MRRQEIVNQRNEIRIEMQRLFERQELARKRLESKLAKLQTKCKHEHKTFYPDPSGNNDSYYECDDCGKYL
jgi:hypothetical protein